MKISLQRLILSLCLLSFLALSTACHTVKGVGKDVKEVGEEIEETAEETRK